MDAVQIEMESFEGKKKFISIQIMRMIACIGVFLVHLGQRTNLGGGNS